jgi:hypothetical protein
LVLVSTLDQRIVSEEVVEGWSEMLKDVAPVFAREAVEEHFKLKPDVYLNVGHVLAGAKRAALRQAERLVSEARLMDEADWKSDPQPVCEEHSSRILECDDCCSLIFVQAGHMRDDDRHSWAMSHVYKAKEAW